MVAKDIAYASLAEAQHLCSVFFSDLAPDGAHKLFAEFQSSPTAIPATSLVTTG